MKTIKFEQLKKKAMQNEGFKKEWDLQTPFWNLQEQLIAARIQANLTQADIAKNECKTKYYCLFCNKE
ncbi:hypothetical protein CQA53_09520 [Helicobacter didelphidarum]|uniref:Uncharacterized protein n=1 Tax=Helicobacter didelphidarum TaxID=2040648 RepID=A0A3D8IAD6_9HELI|nr:hypothetical protein [Helicobacter didelphidarum]RDU62112.1 hypothetical protein CQA53_09520 [Helicobacter didelphidarum]